MVVVKILNDKNIYTYYELLRITRTAPQDGIKTAYDILIRQLKLLSVNDTNILNKIEDADHAYAVLSDPNTRKQYDKWVKEQEIRLRQGLKLFDFTLDKTVDKVKDDNFQEVLHKPKDVFKQQEYHVNSSKKLNLQDWIYIKGKLGIVVAIIIGLTWILSSYILAIKVALVLYVLLGLYSWLAMKGSFAPNAGLGALIMNMIFPIILWAMLKSYIPHDIGKIILGIMIIWDIHPILTMSKKNR